MSHDRLVTMANQIAKFFASQGEATATDEVALHLKRYWDPRMRRAIIAQVRQGEAGALDPVARRAVEQLAAEADGKTPVASDHGRLPSDVDRAKIEAGFTASESGIA